MFKPGELPFFDEVRDAPDVVEGFRELLIRDSLLLHLKHCGVTFREHSASQAQ